MSVRPVLIGGEWRASTCTKTFRAANPATTEALAEEYPVSPWTEVEEAIDAAFEASRAVRGFGGDRFAAFLERYADNVDARAAELVEAAHTETALPVSPRLKDAELPRTSNQLRQAAVAAR